MSRMPSIGFLKRIARNYKLSRAMFGDIFAGRYRKFPVWTIIAFILAVFYVANPLDLLPDGLFILGYVDDLTVVFLCMVLLEKDLVAYVRWKELQNPHSDGEVDYD